MAKRVNYFETKNTLVLLGSTIKVERKRKKMSEQELANRVRVSRSTLRRIEAGDPSCEIGSVFDAAYVVGIQLIGDSNEKDRLSKTVNSLLDVLPKRIKHKDTVVDDNF